MWERCSAGWEKRVCSSARKASAPARRACGSGLRPARARSSTARSKGTTNCQPASASCVRGRYQDAIEWATREAESWPWGRPGDRHPPCHRTVGHRDDCAAGRRQHAPLHGPAQGHRLYGKWRDAFLPATDELARLIDETTRSGVHLVTETMRPSRRGRRYKNSRDGVSVYDRPFTETKELIGGYVVVSAASLEDAGRWACAVP